MKTNINLCSSVSLIVLVLLLSSCERLFEKDADYRYRIENNTNSTVEVVVEIQQNPRVVVYGDPNQYYTLKSGGTAEVWVTSGFATDEVYDEEKNNKEIYWIKVSANSNGRQARNNLNSTSRWEFKKHSSHKASYTLTLTEDLF